MGDARAADRKEQVRVALPAIRRILMVMWDPIGVRNEPAAKSEYDQDALALFGLMANGGSDAELSAYLAKTEDEIGLGGGSVSPHSAIIAALRALGVGPTGPGGAV